jgi:hypothetical protein
VVVRKIHRMRKPIFLECLEMRADFDPEYLGVRLPGSALGTPSATATPIEEDLALVRADVAVREKFRLLAATRRRQVLDFRRWLLRFGSEQPPPVAQRAMTVAYTIDYHHVRRYLEATQRLEEASEEAAGSAAAPAAGGGRPRRLAASCWCRLRHGGKIRRLLDQPAFARYDLAQRRRLRRLICGRRGPLLEAVRCLTRAGVPDDPVGHARNELLAVALDPDTWSRQLVVLRAVQTLSVLDLQTYCDLVAELGEYDTSMPEVVDQR